MAVVFFDIDGTIVDDATQQIPASTVRAVHALRENGHLPVINTGRPFAHIDPRVRAMDFGAWICGCGMQVLLGGELLYSAVPTEAQCRRAVERARECGLMLAAEGETALRYDSTVAYSGLMTREMERMRRRGIPVEDLRAEGGMEFLKFVTLDAPGCDRDRFLRETEADFESIDRGCGMIEYVLRGHSKAGGMERLLRVLGIPRSETYAIGDSTNDLPMFAHAATTICMGNGMEEAKAQADFVTESVLEDGIYAGLRHFSLI